MRVFKPAAIIVALLLILSCNHGRDESDVKALNGVIVMETPLQSDKANNITNPETGDITGEVKNGFTNHTNDEKKQQHTEQKKDRQKLPPATEQEAKPDWDKKIIKTASVNLEVKDYSSYYSSTREKVKNMGGYIAQEEQSQSGYKIENLMIIKVPVDQFDNAVTQLSAGVQKINERKISSQDVTMEMVDTKSRIEAKKQVRQRYIDLLGQAKNMEEILNVQSEINGIQEEIESATGRIQYLGHSSVFSTINLTYYQVLNSSAKDTEKANPSFGEKVKGAFHTGWEIVSNLFIVIITIWPLLLGSFFAFLLYRKLRVHKPKQA